jgi:hypothetical protein
MFARRRLAILGTAQPYAGYAFAADFKNSWYRGSNGILVRDPTLLPGYSYSRSGAKSEARSSDSAIYPFAANIPGIVPNEGYWSRTAFTNLLLNAGSSADLVTQSVTVAASAYTLSFVGTGTVALSGTSTAGPLVGTGASNRVSLTFTPTAGTLTLTVTGSCKYAGLVLGAQPAPIIATAGSAASTAADALLMSLPLAVDEDFFMWGAAQLSGATGGFGYIFQVDSGADTNRFYAARNGGTGTLEFFANSANVSKLADASITFGVSDYIVLGIRRRAGKWTASAKVNSTVTIRSEGAVTAFPVGLNRVNVGQNSSANQTNGVIGGVFRRTGTFSDADLTAILGAA